MAQAKKAPGNGVIRNDTTGHARRVSAGGLIPDGWSFDDGSAPAKSAAKGRGKKPKETTEAAGPSDTADQE